MKQLVVWSLVVLSGVLAFSVSHGKPKAKGTGSVKNAVTARTSGVHSLKVVPGEEDERFIHFSGMPTYYIPNHAAIIILEQPLES